MNYGVTMSRLVGVPEDIISAEIKNPAARPNVYFLSADSYLDQEVLRELFGIDNSGFIRALEQKGFVFPKRTTSNFPGTIYSLNTTLKMAFHDMVEMPKNEAIERFVTTGFGTIAGPSITSVEMKRRGYAYVFAENGFLESVSCTGHVDICLNSQFGSAELFSSIVQMTPGVDILPNIKDVFPDLSTMFALRRASDIQATGRQVYETFTMDLLADMPLGDFPEPYFFVTHAFGMHNIAWARDCSFIGFTQSSQFTQQQLTDYYRDQLHCLNEQFLTGINSIIERDPAAIIVVTSDHGTSLGYQQSTRSPDEWADNPTATEQLFRILLGFRFPEECRDLPYDGVSLVNVMRLIFSCIDGRPYELLPDRQFLLSVGGWRDHPYFMEVHVNE